MRRLRSLGGPGLDAGTVVYPPGGTFGPRHQDAFQLVHLHDGALTVMVNGRPREISPGQVYLSRPGATEHFRWAAHRDTRHSWIAMAPDRLDAGLKRELLHAPDVLPLSDAHDRLVEAMLAMPAVESPASLASLAALGVAMFRLYLAEAADSAGPAPVPDPVRRAQRHALAGLAAPLVLPDLARAAHVTPEHLIRLFRRATGQTPMAWVWSRRDREGARLLAGSGLTGAQIADRLGYQTPFHFSRRIKRATGTSPRRLRERAWRQR